MTILLVFLVLSASVLLFAWFRQDSLIYFPDRYGLEDLVRSARAADLAPWSAAEDYRGLVSQPPAGEGRGTVIVFHGNAGSARDRTYFRDTLLPLGFRVLLAEYPGYGPRKGSLGEKSLTGDARETVRLVRERFPGPVYLWGESLGCAVATAAAGDLPREVAGVALVTPWVEKSGSSGEGLPGTRWDLNPLPPRTKCGSTFQRFKYVPGFSRFFGDAFEGCLFPLSVICSINSAAAGILSGKEERPWEA